MEEKICECGCKQSDHEERVGCCLSCNSEADTKKCMGFKENTS